MSEGRADAATAAAVADEQTVLSQKLEWIERTYYSTLTSQLGINITYLNQNITWAFTVLTIALGYILGRATFPDDTSFLLCLLLWNVGVHLATRAGKAYVNVMRFTVIERDFQAYFLREKGGSPQVLLESISQYHWRWASPVSRATVMKKLLFELGFGYVLGLVLALWVYVGKSLYPERWVLWSSLAALCVSGIDLSVNLLRSSFLKSVVEHHRADRLR